MSVSIKNYTVYFLQHVRKGVYILYACLTCSVLLSRSPLTVNDSHTHSLTYLLTHSLSLTYLLTYSITHALTHARTHPLTHVLTHSRTHAHNNYLLSPSHLPFLTYSLTQSSLTNNCYYFFSNILLTPELPHSKNHSYLFDFPLLTHSLF
jgi:hypothetical protein